VGFAPKDNPRVAVATVIVNDPLWRIRATWLGREAMRLALNRLPKPPQAVAGQAVPPPESPSEASPASPEPQGEEEPGDEEVGQAAH
jgi:hypothetical protein